MNLSSDGCSGKQISRQIPEIHIVKTVLFSNEYQKSRETREILRERESKREREREIKEIDSNRDNRDIKDKSLYQRMT